MPAETFYRFEGGPLDGQERKKTTPARTPLYLDVEGRALDIVKGARVTNSRLVKRRPKAGPFACYMCRDMRAPAQEDRTTYVYTYQTAFDSEETLP